MNIWIDMLVCINWPSYIFTRTAPPILHAFVHFCIEYRPRRNCCWSWVRQAVSRTEGQTDRPTKWHIELLQAGVAKDLVPCFLTVYNQKQVNYAAFPWHACIHMYAQNIKQLYALGRIKKTKSLLGFAACHFYSTVLCVESGFKIRLNIVCI